MPRCPGHSQHGQLLTELEEMWPQGCVLYGDTPSSAQNIGKRVPKPTNMPHPTSPLITARATKTSKANQTVAQLPPPFPAGKTLGTGIVPGQGGVENLRVRESSLPTTTSTGFVGEHSATPQHGPNSEGSPSTLATGCLWHVGEQGGQQIHGGEGWPEGQVASGGLGMGTVLLSHAGTWHLCTLEWRVCSGPTRLITMPPVGGTFPQIQTFCFFHMLPYGPIFLHKQSCTRAKKWRQSFTCVPIMSKPEVTWLW